MHININNYGILLNEHSHLLHDYFMSLSEKGGDEDIGQKDALAKALGKEEHGGRVTGVGVGVTNREYFGAISTKKEYMDQVSKLCSRVQSLERQVKKMRRKNCDIQEEKVDEEEKEEQEHDEEPGLFFTVEKENMTTSSESVIPRDIPEVLNN